MVNFIEGLKRMVDLALENELTPPFIALVSEENPQLTHIPDKTLWPALINTEFHGVVKVDVYKDSQYIEQSAFGWSKDFVKVVSADNLLRGLLEHG